MSISVEDVPERRLYEVRLDGERAGELGYRDAGDVRTFVHTEVDQRFQGQGVASALVRAAVEDVLDRGLTLVPLCPYVVSWLEKHADVAQRVSAAAAAAGTPDSD
jgi:predicted GNAT family acetyltransferase